MGRIVIPRPRRSTQRFYRPGPKLEASEGGKFGAAELQFLTKAIDTAIAVGGKVIGSVQRSQIDKGITGDAVKAAALQAEPSGLGGPEASRAVAAAQEAATTPSGQVMAFQASQQAAAPPTEGVAVEMVQEGRGPIVAMSGSAAPERAALLARMEEAHADFGSEWASSPPAPFSGPGTYAEGVQYPLVEEGFVGEGLTPRHEAPSRPYFETQGPPSAYQLGPLAEALGRAQALVHHANETGDVRHLDPARKLYEGIIESGVLTDEQHAAVIDSEPFKAAFSAEWWGGSQEAGATGSIAAAIERAQALEAQAKESGNPDYLSEAWSVYDDISSGRHGALTDEQRSALIASPLINSAPFRAAFVGELPEVGGAMAPTAAAPVAQPTARPAPQQRTMMSASSALIRQRAQEAARERQRAAAFSPQSLRRMRPGQLRAVLRFAKTPQEAAAVMGAIRMAPEVQPMGLGDVLGGGHIARAQEVKGWKPPSVKAPPSEFEQTMKLQRHNAWLRESQARAKSSGALTDQRRAAIKAAQDKASAKLKKLAARIKGAGSAGKKNAAMLDSVGYWIDNHAERKAGNISDAAWTRGAGEFSGVQTPAALTIRAQRLGMRKKLVSRVGQAVDDLRQKGLPTPPKDRRLLSDAQEGIQRRELDKAQKQIGRLTADIEIAQARMANQGEFPLNLPEEDTGYPPTTPEVLTESLIMWAKERDSKQALLDKISERLAAHEAAVMEDQGAGIPTYVPGTPSAPVQLKSSGKK